MTFVTFAMTFWGNILTPFRLSFVEQCFFRACNDIDDVFLHYTLSIYNIFLNISKSISKNVINVIPTTQNRYNIKRSSKRRQKKTPKRH